MITAITWDFTAITKNITLPIFNPVFADRYASLAITLSPKLLISLLFLSFAKAPSARSPQKIPLLKASQKTWLRPRAILWKKRRECRRSRKWRKGLLPFWKTWKNKALSSQLSPPVLLNKKCILLQRNKSARNSRSKKRPHSCRCKTPASGRRAWWRWKFQTTSRHQPKNMSFTTCQTEALWATRIPTGK